MKGGAKFVRRIRKGASFLCALLFGFTLAFSGGKCRFFSVSPKEKAIRELRAYPENIRNERLYDFARAYIDRYLSDYGEREIACWKAVTDLSGRNYTLFELLPTGYLLYDNESGIVLESAANSPSPYRGEEGELFYGGIKNYFRKRGEDYQSIRTRKLLSDSDRESIEKETAVLSERNRRQPAISVLSYLDGEQSLDEVRILMEEERTLASPHRADKAQPSVSMDSFFPLLTDGLDMGYRAGGVCGYIGANLVLAYNDIAYENGLVPDAYIDRKEGKILGPSLTNRLLEINGQDPNRWQDFPRTDAHEMGDVVRKFLESDSHVSKPWKVTTWLGIINAIGAIDKQQPPVLFGNYRKPGQDEAHPQSSDKDSPNTNHAVVAYGYRRSGLFGYQFRVHFGWNHYADVQLHANAIGSNLILSFF